MPKDFLSNQIKTGQIIGSGSQDRPEVVIINSSVTDGEGTINADVLSNKAGPDVFLFVSGAIGGKDSATVDSVSVFGGDVVISGSLYDGNGDLITGGGDGFPTGSISITGSITHTQGINIGNSPDNDYSDGLFTDFTSNTLLGDVVDRFNAVLAELAPKEAPELSTIDANSSPLNAGVSAYLSFGTSNDLSQAPNNYNSVLQTIVGGDPVSYLRFDSVNVNEEYVNSDQIDNFFKLGVHDGTTGFYGKLNYHVTEDVYTNQVVNYPNDSFSKANQGTLSLYLNNTLLHTIDLTDLTLQGESYNNNNSGFQTISLPNKSRFSNNSEFDLFVSRTAFWVISPADQVNGLNYAFVKHAIGAAENITTVAQWVNDSNNDSLTANNNILSIAGDENTLKTISGVKYFTSANISYSTEISNFYKFVYGKDPVTFTTIENTESATLNFSNFDIPVINTDAGEDETKVLNITTSSNIGLPQSNRIITNNASGISLQANITHPLKSINSTNTLASANGILIDNQAPTSTDTFEGFDDENNRLLNGNYISQSDINSGTWDSTQTLNTGNSNYENGLLIHNGKLMSPGKDSIVNSGNFSSLDNGPQNNVDYSSNVSATEKVYIRKFTNNTNNVVRDFRYNISGDGTFIEGTTFGSGNNNFNLCFKIPGQTGWLDAAKNYTYNNISDSNGGNIGTLDSTISDSPTNHFTFGIEEIANTECMLMRIKANYSWDGDIDDVDITFNTVGQIQNFSGNNSITSNTNNVSGNLSFGSSFTDPNFQNVLGIANDANLNEVDVNEFFGISSTRRGIFEQPERIHGIINDNVSASGNFYSNDAWGHGFAHVGFLKLEVNGSIIDDCTINLSTFESGSQTNGTATGFFEVSAPQVSRDNNNLPDFRFFYRTGEFSVGTSDQRSGWNYARVIHDKDDGSSPYVTNYIEWVVSNDIDQPSILRDNVETGFNSNIWVNVYNSITGSVNYLSGVGYYSSATGEFVSTIQHPYNHVYSNSNSAISFPVSTNIQVNSIDLEGDCIVNTTVNSNVSPMPDIDITNPTALDENLVFTANFSYNYNKSLPGNYVTARIQGSYAAPLQTTTSSTLTLPQLLMFNVQASNDLSVTFEDFSAETYRLQDDTILNQAAISGLAWDSSISLVDAANTSHNTGLQVYDGSLIYPEGNFNSIFLTGIKTPNTNINYDNLTGERTFYRKFENITSSSKFGFDLRIKGTNTTISTVDLSDASNSLSANEIKVYAKIPTTSNSQTTGFMDLGIPFAPGQTSDNDGCLQGTLNDEIVNTETGTQNKITFGTSFLSPNDYVIIKIVADESWSGELNRIEVVWSE